MKKISAFVALVALAACGGYDYYRGGVRYYQDGWDCIYSSDEVANNYSANVDSADMGKEIVYRNTRCSDLYARDMAGQMPRNERRVLTPATNDYAYQEPVVAPRDIVVKQVAPVAKKSCGCNKCNKAVSTKQYVVVGM